MKGPHVRAFLMGDERLVRITGYGAGSRGVDRDLRHADHKAAPEGVGAERVVEQRGRLVLQLDGRALEHSRRALRLERLQRAPVEEEQRSALGGDGTVAFPVSTEAPGSITKSVNSTVLPPPVRLSPLPSWSTSPCTNGETEPGS